MKLNQKSVYIIIGIIFIVLFSIIYIIEIKNSRVVITGKTGAVLSEAVPSETPAAAASEAPRSVKVYITGKVAKPGVYEVDAEARVDDVLKLAGGATAEADLININLAERVSDAQHIVVYAIGDSVDKTAAVEHNDIENSGLININTASRGELMELPGIGEVTADGIIDYREKNGGFAVIEDLKNVNRIGDKTFDNLKDMITVE